MTLAEDLRAQRLLSTSWVACPKGIQSLDLLLDYMNSDPRLSECGISPLKRTPLTVKRFANLERLPAIEDSVRENHVYLHQSFTQGEDPAATHLSGEILDLIFSVYTAVSCHAEHVSLDLGFFPYGRSDKVFEGGQAILCKLFFKLLDTAAAGRGRQILTYDLHNEAIAGFVDGFRMDAVSAAPLLALYLKSLPEFQDGIPVKVLAPDEAGVKRAKKLADMLGCGVAYVDKSREQGKEAQAHEIVGDVDGFVVVQYDDMIDSGGTAINNSHLAMEKNARNVIIVASHGLFSKEIGKESPEEKFRRYDYKVVVMDTVPRPPGFLLANRDWFTMLTCAGNRSDLFLGPYFGDRVRDVRQRYGVLACSKKPFDQSGRLILPPDKFSLMNHQGIAYNHINQLVLPNQAYCRSWNEPESFLEEYFKIKQSKAA